MYVFPRPHLLLMHEGNTRPTRATDKKVLFPPCRSCCCSPPPRPHPQAIRWPTAPLPAAGWEERGSPVPRGVHRAGLRSGSDGGVLAAGTKCRSGSHPEVLLWGGLAAPCSSFSFPCIRGRGLLNPWLSVPEASRCFWLCVASR